MRLRTTLFACAAAIFTVGHAATAQTRIVPTLDWRTIETRYFIIHYPRAAEAWTLEVARHIDAVHDAVSSEVGNAPAHRVTIVVEDPSNQSNGYAVPMLEDPLIYFWPMPPDPTSGIGDSRGWGEILSVHEYTHIAHLTRPTRNPWQRLLTRLSPLRVGPIAIKAPRWVDEGYATYVEGKLTGSGRPHSPWRAAVLREWALEGKLPTYGQLSSDSRFLGGDMAYLAGSAFLEWLVDRKGDSSLVHLWRRMSAREDRTFDDAFAGVFGGYPSDLYGRFAAELTGRALDVERHVDAAVSWRADSGRGTTVQSLDWGTGAPAVSPNGKLLAIVLARRDAPSRVVIWPTARDSADTAAARTRDSLLARDPEDVPAIVWRPAAKPPLATLHPHAGFAYAEPRFMPNGHDVLLVRRSVRGDGLLRDDLFIWDARTGSVRRVTHNAGIRTADPSRDGRRAIADRCVEGICDLVVVDLATGTTRTLASGSPGVVYFRPRYSNDGSRVVVSVQRGGRWGLELVDPQAASPVPNAIGAADGVDRYEAAFLPGDTSVVFTTDSGGIPNIAVMQLATGEQHALTAVASAASAPAPDRRSRTVYFLRLHANGLDLASVADTAFVPTISTSPALEPATPAPTVVADTFARGPVRGPRSYGAGPRNLIVLPTASFAAEGKSLGAMVAGTDPLGRLTWMATGVYGDRGTWRGGSMAAAWRGWPVAVSAEAFYADEHPSEQHGPAAPTYLDASYTGGDLVLGLEHEYTASAHAVWLGASGGRLDGARYANQARSLGVAGYRGAFRQTPNDWRLDEHLGLSGAAGRTADSSWARGTIGAAVTVARGGLALSAQGAYGQVARGAPAYEEFALGGTSPLLYNPQIGTQRIAMPAVPLAIATGRRMAAYRVDLPFSLFSPYYWAGSAGSTLHTWHRIVGMEASIDATGLSAIHVPDMRVVAGAGYSLDEPTRHHTTFYLNLVYRP